MESWRHWDQIPVRFMKAVTIRIWSTELGPWCMRKCQTCKGQVENREPVLTNNLSHNWTPLGHISLIKIFYKEIFKLPHRYIYSSNSIGLELVRLFFFFCKWKIKRLGCSSAKKWSTVEAWVNLLNRKFVC